MLIHTNGRRQRCERAVLRGGVIGYQLPALKAEVLPLQRSDTVILATDGVEPEYSDDLTLHVTPQAVADEIMAGHGRATDDALVLVARYQGAHRSTGLRTIRLLVLADTTSALRAPRAKRGCAGGRMRSAAARSATDLAC
jgi:hypothetical protein